MQSPSNLTLSFPLKKTFLKRKSFAFKCFICYCTKVFFFRWLAKDEDDGQIVRELPVGDTATLLKSMFLITT